jgi:hypothetical protein
MYSRPRLREGCKVLFARSGGCLFLNTWVELLLYAQGTRWETCNDDDDDDDVCVWINQV